ncbi:hypothetical protein R1sor_004790 [Riccia sorocarpa]|uniref:Uncharacterized protein n=1 Tax=Riccia sorocarpa TaxID=122646 RepID=A0ABD3HL81_9MARC
MPEGINSDSLFTEKRPPGDKNGYKFRTYKDPFRKVLAEALLGLFCPTRIAYVGMHKVAFIERLLLGERVNWGGIFCAYVQSALQTVGNGSPVFIGAFLVHLHRANGWLSSQESALFSENSNPYLVNLVSEDEDEDEDEDHVQVEGEVLPAPHSPPASPTSPNYSPIEESEGRKKQKKRQNETLHEESSKRQKKPLRIEIPEIVETEDLSSEEARRPKEPKEVSRNLMRSSPLEGRSSKGVVISAEYLGNGGCVVVGGGSGAYNMMTRARQKEDDEGENDENDEGAG